MEKEVKFTIRQFRTIRGAIDSAALNEREFIAAHMDRGRCIDPKLVRKTKAFIERMLKIDASIQQELIRRKRLVKESDWND